MTVATSLIASQPPPSLDRWGTRTAPVALTVATAVSGEPVPSPAVTEHPGIRAFTEAQAPPPLDFLAPCGPQRWCAPDPPKVRRKAAMGQRGRSVGQCAGDMEACLAAIARCESGGRYDAENSTSTASGRYQVLKTTWAAYSGYVEAKDAPPEVQERWAREAFAKAGTRPWAASRHCWSR